MEKLGRRNPRSKVTVNNLLIAKWTRLNKRMTYTDIAKALDCDVRTITSAFRTKKAQPELIDGINSLVRKTFE